MTSRVDYSLASVEQLAHDIGERLSRIRLGRNLTQQALAAQAGISTRTLRRLEAGEGATLDTLIRVVRGLGLESHLEALLPDPGIQPVERLARGGHERKRARAPVPVVGPEVPWTWGEDETP